MLWSLWIIYFVVLILVAGKFKAKSDTYIFRFKTFCLLHGLTFVKIALISNI